MTPDEIAQAKEELAEAIKLGEEKIQIANQTYLLFLYLFIQFARMPLISPGRETQSFLSSPFTGSYFISLVMKWSTSTFAASIKI